MIIPRVGDVWEFKLPNKTKRLKEIGKIYMAPYSREDGTMLRSPFIEWTSLTKGRHTGINVRELLKYGTRISSKVENDRLKKNIENELFSPNWGSMKEDLKEHLLLYPYLKEVLGEQVAQELISIASFSQWKRHIRKC